jgi:hypothetical protein
MEKKKTETATQKEGREARKKREHKKNVGGRDAASAPTQQ